jgi:hypothetical protein
VWKSLGGRIPIVFTGRLKNKLYLVDFNKSKAKLETCLVVKSSMGWLWHR